MCLRRNTKADAPHDYIFICPARRNSDWGLYVSASHKGQDSAAPQFSNVASGSDEEEEPPFHKLAPFARNYYYRVMTSQLELAQYHRDWLLKRGLSLGFIAYLFQLGARSFDPETDPILKGLSKHLAGVDVNQDPPVALHPIWNEDLSFVEGGLLLPLTDVNENILGFQVVPGSRISAEAVGQKVTTGKYKFLTSKLRDKTKNEPDTFRLSDEQNLPHGFYRPPINQYPNTLFFTEGALKGAVTAFLLGGCVLATMNAGTFNPYQVEWTIKKGDFTRFILCPDAGMGDEKHLNIAKAYHDLNRIIIEAGYRLEVFSWDQSLDKELGDIDDKLLELTEIKDNALSRVFSDLC